MSGEAGPFVNTRSNEHPPCGHCCLFALGKNWSEDIVRYLTKSPENQAAGDNFKTRLSASLTPELLCLLLYRISHYLHVKRWQRLAVVVSRLNLFLHKVSITPESCIGPGCRLSHPAGVTFQGRAGRGLTLYSLAVCCAREGFGDGPAERGPRLGDRVTVGAHAVLMGPINVGDDSKIPFSVVLDQDSPPGALVFSRCLRLIERPVVAPKATRQT